MGKDIGIDFIYGRTVTAPLLRSVHCSGQITSPCARAHSDRFWGTSLHRLRPVLQGPMCPSSVCSLTSPSVRHGKSCEPVQRFAKCWQEQQIPSTLITPPAPSISGRKWSRWKAMGQRSTCAGQRRPTAIHNFKKEATRLTPSARCHVLFRSTGAGYSNRLHPYRMR